MSDPVENAIWDRIGIRLHYLYGDRASALVQRLRMVVGRYGVGEVKAEQRPWDQSDLALITYGDMVQAEGELPLVSLKHFLDDRMGARISLLHILPFFPYSSDDGFSVKDFRAVDPALGNWSDIRELATRYDLMVDLVINHVSRQSSWFREYINGVAPFTGYFHEIDPAADLSAVVRPRSHPLLTPVQTRSGGRHLWTTFSADQIDVNIANPEVLFEFIDILLWYIAQGARVVRLDAIAFLWKEIGTNCLHLTQTHEIVKLFRDLIDLVAPSVLLLTETNVPHEENLSYFGEGDEAHWVYQFSLPPLLAQGLLAGNAGPLNRWVRSLPRLDGRRAFFNFTASHDGVGVRPLQGLISDEALTDLVRHVERVGGHVAMRSMPDGSQQPYELNITYFDLFADHPTSVSERQIARFLSAQAIMLSMRGIPAVYFNSLFGARNDGAGVEESGQARRINRHKWTRSELDAALEDEEGHHAHVFDAYLRLLELRKSQSAFHPEGDQRVLDFGDRFFALERHSPDASETILCITNFSDEAVGIPPLHHGGGWFDLITHQRWPLQGKTAKRVNPWQTVWLKKVQS